MISLKDSNRIRGLCILIIVASHVFSGVNFNLGVIILRVLIPANVAFFLFASGYGLNLKYQKEGTLYLESFLTKKL